MARLLVKNVDLLATFDDARREIADGAMLVDGNVIAAVGTTAELSGLEADRVLDLSGHVVMPGMVNTHHHMYQNLTRVMVQDDELLVWLKTLYPIWARLDDDAIRISAKVAMAELIHSGCTTSSDHLYILPNNCTLDSSIEAAQEMGLRFHAARGAMSRGESQGGLPPDSCVENEDAILKDAERLIGRYHDASRHSMSRIVLAPCSPFSVTPDLMRDAAALARSHPGVRLHSHLAEDLFEETYCHDIYGMRPVEFAESVGWLGDDVWFAHSIFMTSAEIDRFAVTGTGVAHCPSANMRCGQGIAKVREMLDKGVKVGLGVDGSASNDNSNLMESLRHALMLGRLKYGAEAITHLDVLRWGTEGSARCLGRSDIGTIAVGKQADLALFDLNALRFSGAGDPLAALVLCGAHSADRVMVGGRWTVEDGLPVGLDLARLRHEHGAAARQFLETVQ